MSDLISRKAAIEALIHHITPHDNGDGSVTIGVLSKSSIKDILNKLPSAQPEAKTPTWKEEDRFVKGYFTWYPYCPKCDHEVVTGQCYCKICGQHIDWSEDDE